MLDALLRDKRRVRVVGGTGLQGVEVEQVERRAMGAAEELHEVRYGVKHLLAYTLHGKPMEEPSCLRS